jgi:hypothetical protein
MSPNLGHIDGRDDWNECDQEAEKYDDVSLAQQEMERNEMSSEIFSYNATQLGCMQLPVLDVNLLKPCE